METQMRVQFIARRRTLSQLNAQSLTVFLISSNSCKLIRISNDSYVIKLPKNGVEVTFTIMGYLNGQNILLGNYRYALKDRNLFQNNPPRFYNTFV